jgi:hypothetical protein
MFLPRLKQGTRREVRPTNTNAPTHRKQLREASARSASIKMCHCPPLWLASPCSVPCSAYYFASFSKNVFVSSSVKGLFPRWTRRAVLPCARPLACAARESKIKKNFRGRPEQADGHRLSYVQARIPMLLPAEIQSLTAYKRGGLATVAHVLFAIAAAFVLQVSSRPCVEPRFR